ncbi:hypothetical protein TCAL_07359 [Tigriopus californicus]|uniref:L-Fucosyltransferase n=1 Tax=Tigriopus californicus TaxID=6832 RepID=A0A553PNH4_TIGCA|nr:galactoside alpha-(1,2)-fucosyltransferase 2-like [Tigriopus californicus]TRY79224.1 hypothetical protein TCAL_07359 [Tigriopus californicus]|eukprot:TCALIF_07359-PA protein Name:"Similar to FUT2 Galactoside 2-alpha-L-fucosyltransferase 2 (Homo sapiens)" AED:0.01 eAED:0.01 QI:60/1/1/1/1/1/3/41/348
MFSFLSLGFTFFKMRLSSNVIISLCATLTHFTGFVQGEDTCDNDSCQKVQPCREFNIKKIGPDSKSIIYGEAHGRLGNQLLGYALLAHFQDELGMEAYINAECRQYLLGIFTEDSITVPVIDSVYCDPKKIPFTPYHSHIREILTDKSYRTGKVLQFFPTHPKFPFGYRPEDHWSKEQEAMQTKYVHFLRETLKFKPSIMTKMKKTMKGVAKKLGLKPKEVTYVGIHNRRTDGLKFMKDNFQQDPLDADYFHDAMEYFREEYENVAFLLVSDDMKWSRENIENREGDLFFVSDGNGDNPESVGFDLAILRYSNHTIITRGTYSMWGSMLCNGEYYTEYGSIVPTHLQG